MNVVLIADAGPLITLACADSLDVVFKPGWSVQLIDMVMHELTRNQTPTSSKIQEWIAKHDIQIRQSTIFQRYSAALKEGHKPRKANLGELAIQEVMQDFVLKNPPEAGVFLFEDHKIARTSFVLPEGCRKVSTRAFLMFLEEHSWIDSASEIERKAVLAGRSFSQLRFP